MAAPEHEPTGRVDTDLVDQLVEGDELSFSLRHLSPLAPFDQVDEAHHQRFEEVGVGAEGGDHCLEPGRVAMMVGAQHVDQQVEPALELVPVVGDVGSEVGGLAVGPDQDPVLVVAEVSAPQPERFVAAIAVALLLELGQGRLDLAARVEVALGEPGVEGDAEAVERPPDLIEGQLDRAPAQDLGFAGIDPLLLEALGEALDVGARVAVLGRRGALDLGGERGGEPGDLTTAVVDVVLALDPVADGLQQADEGVAVGRVAAASDVQWPGWVCGDELDEDPLRVGGRHRPEALALLAEAGQRPPVPGVGEEQVEEPGAGDLDPVEAPARREIALEHLAEPRGYVARRFAKGGREEHRRVRAVVAELGLGRSVQRRLGARRLAVAQGARRLVHRRAQLGYRVGHRHLTHRMSHAGPEYPASLAGSRDRRHPLQPRRARGVPRLGRRSRGRRDLVPRRRRRLRAGARRLRRPRPRTVLAMPGRQPRPRGPRRARRRGLLGDGGGGREVDAGRHRRGDARVPRRARAGGGAKRIRTLPRLSAGPDLGVRADP